MALPALPIILSLALQAGQQQQQGLSQRRNQALQFAQQPLPGRQAAGQPASPLGAAPGASLATPDLSQILKLLQSLGRSGAQPGALPQ